MTKENAIIGELWVRAHRVKKYLVQLDRRTLLWITKPQGYSIFVTLSSMGQARAGDVLRRLGLPAGRDESKGVRKKFDTLVEAGFLDREEEGDLPDKYYGVTVLGKRLSSACAPLILSLERQSVEKIKNEGGNLALLDLVRGFAPPGDDTRKGTVGEIPENPPPQHLNNRPEDVNCNQGAEGKGNSRGAAEDHVPGPPVPATSPRAMKRSGSRDG